MRSCSMTMALVVSPLPYRRRLVGAGAAAVEHAAASLLFDRHPDRDEGWLSQRRSHLTSGAALSRTAAALLPNLPGFAASDRQLLALIGAALLDSGPATGAEFARKLLGH